MPDPPSDDAEATLELNASQTVQRWGGLVLRQKIGQGGFGEVYRAWDEALDREVALKLLRKGDGSQIKSEAKLIAKVRHENVAAVYGVAEHEGRVGLWMEFVDGRTLDRLVRTQGRLGPREAAAIAIDLCRALAAVHATGLLHCDIKAQNVMRAEGGRIVLMDFGLSQGFGVHRDPTRLGGTPAYMAPELFEGKLASVQSDIYALGVLLHFLVTGTFPVEGTTWSDFRNPERQKRVNLLRDVRPDLPESYLRIVERALEESSQRRYETAGQMLQALAGDWTHTPSQLAALETGLPRRNFLRNALIAGSAAAGAGALAIWRFRGTASSAVRFIAVLPFENLSRDPDNEYFTDGITEELVNALTRVPGLRVVARTSVFRFKGQHPEPKELGKQLGVDSILSGSIRKSADRIRAAVNLVSARDGYQLWSDVYERPLRDTFEIQASIAESVAEKLQLQFAPGRKPVRREFTQADTDYLQGLFHAARSTPAELQTAIKYYKKAIAGRPDYALAWAGLAEAWALTGYYDPERHAEASANAKPAVAKALALDGTLAEAYNARALIQMEYEWDWPGAEASVLEATRLNPGYAHAWQLYSNILVTEGRFDEGLSAARRSFELDPLSLPASNQLGICFYLMRRYDQAFRQFSGSLDLDPRSFVTHVMLGWVNLGLNQRAKAFEEMNSAAAFSGNSPLGITCVIVVHALANDSETARRLLAESEKNHPAAFLGPGLRATISSALGDKDEAFRYLDLAYLQHDSRLMQIRINPGLEPIRSDPRFAELVRKLKIGGP